MTDRETKPDFEIDALLAQAAGDVPKPSGDLLRRIAEDADAVATRRRSLPDTAPRRRRGVFLAVLGGWPAVAGLTTATIVGLWLGYAPPAVLDSIVDAVPLFGAGFDPQDFMVSIDGILVEG